jgi:hypothetical protein
MGDIHLFISHSHKDKNIAADLVSVVEAALIPPDDKKRILCTSHDNEKYHPGYRAGQDVSPILREHLSESSCVLGVLTPESLGSRWVMFELGGAWAKATLTLPLLARGVSLSDLSDMPTALSRDQAVNLTEPDDIRKMIKQLEATLEKLGWKDRDSAISEIDRLKSEIDRLTMAALKSEIDRLTTAAREQLLR